MINQSIIAAHVAINKIEHANITHEDATTKPLREVRAMIEQLQQDADDHKKLMDAAIRAYEGAIYAERQIGKVYRERLELQAKKQRRHTAAL
ncbi:MAG TPA: hypothetical protein VNH18_08155 [Bryobacteraceae bacterium]|nr:hypothetical protein [Bryobacteraceae bacterium]